MFTGIVQSKGRIAARHDNEAGDTRLHIASPGFDATRFKLGDSIAVNGACLTATGFQADGFWADVSAETLSCTTLGRLAVGSEINLEPALRFNDSLDGHLVSGHVDGVGELTSRAEDGRSRRLRFRFPAPLAAYVATKGSICVDGVSLTVNDVTATDFGVNIVPHTLEVTTLGKLAVGAQVNLEVDLVARYLERMLAVRMESGPA